MHRKGERALPAGEAERANGRKGEVFRAHEERCPTGVSKRSVRLQKSIITDQAGPLQFFGKNYFSSAIENL